MEEKAGLPLNAQAFQLGPKREQMIIRNSECAPISYIESRARDEIVDPSIAAIILFRARHPVRQGVQCWPQR